MSLLVIEDEKDIREVLRSALELEGYRTFTASNGQEGLQALERLPRPCLILLDMMMPVMNGWEFLKALKESDVLATIPVVVVSAAGERARDSKANGFIKKPIDLDLLLELVKRYCPTPGTPAIGTPRGPQGSGAV